MKAIIAFTLLLLPGTTTKAQQVPYKNLVMEGGGIRGFAFAGALEILDSIGILKSIERIGGSSSGAIQATLIAIGYTPAEIKKAAASVPLKEFNDGFLPGGFYRMSKKFGFYKGENLHRWIDQIIKAKTGDANITFLQLHELKQTKNYKELYITGTDLSHRCLRVFSFETYPNMRIKDALRISISIPLYFEPLLIDENGTIQYDRRNKNFHMMVDGGLLSNYPVHIFDSTRYIQSGKENYYVLNNETVGMLLDKPEAQLLQQKSRRPLTIQTLSQYVSAVYQTIIDKPNPDPSFIRRTISISHLNLPGRVRKLSEATIQKLVESGRQGVRNFFSANPVQGLLPSSQ